MACHVPTTSVPRVAWRARAAVDAGYVVCVVVPLLATTGSPAWYPAMTGSPRPTSDHVVGFLVVGWAGWIVALLGTTALAVRYDVDRHHRRGTDADLWDRIALRLLAVTAAVGVVMTLVLVGVLVLTRA